MVAESTTRSELDALTKGGFFLLTNDPYRLKASWPDWRDLHNFSKSYELEDSATHCAAPNGTKLFLWRSYLYFLRKVRLWSLYLLTDWSFLMAALIRFPTPDVGYRAPCRCNYSRTDQFVRISLSISAGTPTMKALSGLITLACVSYTYATFSPAGSVRDVHKADKGVPSLGVPQSVQQTWAMFAPYYPAASYVKPPKGCSIDQVRPRFPVFVSSYSSGCR